VNTPVTNWINVPIIIPEGITPDRNMLFGGTGTYVFTKPYIGATPVAVNQGVIIFSGREAGFMTGRIINNGTFCSEGTLNATRVMTNLTWEGGGWTFGRAPYTDRFVLTGNATTNGATAPSLTSSPAGQVVVLEGSIVTEGNVSLSIWCSAA